MCSHISSCAVGTATATSAAAVPASKARATAAPSVVASNGGEPDLAGVCSNDSDKVTLRNILYTLWALNRSGEGAPPSRGLPGACSSTSCYMVRVCIRLFLFFVKKYFMTSICSIGQGYNIRRLRGKGYLLLAFFGQGFGLAVQDMQLIMDVCPLRIDSLFVREPRDDDACNLSSKVAAVMSICVLDSEQPVRITEAEVVRVRKRSRGLLLGLGWSKT
jgi:hypothetical protein